MCLEFFTSVLCTQERGTEYYYVTANKTRDVFYDSGPLNSIKLENTWGGALISVDVFKITFLHILFLYFYNGFIFGVGEVVYIRNHFCVSILIGLKLRVWIYDERQTDYPSKSFFISSNREREYYTDTLILFLCLAEKSPKPELENYFFYELTLYPTFLLEDDAMRTTKNEVKLNNYFLDGTITSEDIDCIKVADAGTLLWHYN